MKDNNHLPVYGVGPYMVIPILLISIIGLILTKTGNIAKMEIIRLNSIMTVAAVIIIIAGIIFWIFAVKSGIDEKIKANNLQTTGIYSIIRHPIYAAFLYVSTGIIVISHNIFLFPLPVIYWAFLTLILKNTEERWLIDTYGDDYIIYSKKVNRFIPKVK